MACWKVLISLLFYPSILSLGFFPSQSFASEANPENLPPLLEITPSTPFEILSPIGAGKKTIGEARHQLQLEARKVQAEAVIYVRCEPGGFHGGMTMYFKDAYCKGTAIRFESETGLRKTPSATGTLERPGM